MTETASQQLSKLDKINAKRIISFLKQRLAVLDNPRSSGKALTGPRGDLWCYQVGDYRIICEIQDDVLCVLAVKIGNRRDVYR
ncbi:MAG: type II toxin-antitoxin system RelE/ParE family toxin [Methylobacter sp.]|nr:type II toxin-antitoxin system RelE/ParE family toxin [Methylobacter sp.]